MPETPCFSGYSTTNSGSSENLHSPQAWIPMRPQYSGVTSADIRLDSSLKNIYGAIA